MSEETRYLIRIVTESDTRGAKETVDELNKLGDKGKRAHQDITDGAEKSHLSHRALTLALRQMGPEFAHLGHLATYGFTDPLVGGLIAITAAAGAVVHQIEEVKEAAARAQEKSNEFSQNWLTAMRTAKEEIASMNTETGTTVKNLDSIIGKLKELGDPEKGLRTSEAIESAIRTVSGQIDQIDKGLSPEDRKTRIGALPGIAAMHDKEAAELLKKVPQGFMESSGLLGSGSLGEHESKRIAEEKAGFISQATASSLKAIGARSELRGLSEQDQRRADLQSQLDRLSEMQEKLPGSRAARAGGQGVGFPQGSLFTQAIMGATIAGEGGVAPPQTQRDMIAVQDFFRHHGVKEAALIELWRHLSSLEISNAQKIKDMQQMVRAAVNKGT